MLHITGRLSDKSLISQGTSKFGQWKILRFSIEKQYKGEKIKIFFTAKGRITELIDKLDYKTKIEIDFYPKCDKVGEKYYTELVAEEVTLYSSKQNTYGAFVGMENVEVDADFRDDLQIHKKM